MVVVYAGAGAGAGKRFRRSAALCSVSARRPRAQSPIRARSRGCRKAATESSTSCPSAPRLAGLLLPGKVEAAESEGEGALAVVGAAGATLQSAALSGRGTGLPSISRLEGTIDAAGARWLHMAAGERGEGAVGGGKGESARVVSKCVRVCWLWPAAVKAMWGGSLGGTGLD